MQKGGGENTSDIFHLVTPDLARFITAYGYWAVMFFVTIKSIGAPFYGCIPG